MVNRKIKSTKWKRGFSKAPSPSPASTKNQNQTINKRRNSEIVFSASDSLSNKNKKKWRQTKKKCEGIPKKTMTSNFSWKSTVLFCKSSSSSSSLSRLPITMKVVGYFFFFILFFPFNSVGDVYSMWISIFQKILSTRRLKKNTNFLFTPPCPLNNINNSVLLDHWDLWNDFQRNLQVHTIRYQT